MSKIINCPSCGAENQLPEGKNSMFCSYCSFSIQQQTKEPAIGESTIKSKPAGESMEKRILNDPDMLKAFGYKKPSFLQLLGKEMGGNCFIATATMGSYDHPIVLELRHFRDNWILEKSWGEAFVKWYYHYGAKAAKFIEKSFVLKKISYLLIVKPLFIISRLIQKKEKIRNFYM